VSTGFVTTEGVNQRQSRYKTCQLTAGRHLASPDFKWRRHLMLPLPGRDPIIW